MPIEGLFIAIGYRPNTEAFRDWLEVDDGRLSRRPRRDRLEDRRRVHRRRRPRPSLSAGGHRGGRRLQGGDRRRALAGVAGHHRSRDRHRVVARAAVRAPAPLRHRADGPGAGPHRARRGDHPGVGRACGQPGRGRPRPTVTARWASPRSTPAAAGCRTCGRFRDRIDRLVGVDIHEPAQPLTHLDEFAIVDLCGPADGFPRGIVRRRAVELHARALRRSARGAREHPALAAAGRHARGDDREPAAPVRRGLPGAAGGSALEGPGAR